MKPKNPRHWLAGARVTKGMTQTDLANICGTSAPAICSYERGLTTPRIETIWKIEEALGIDWKEQERKSDLSA